MSEAWSFGRIFSVIGKAIDPADQALIHGDHVTSWGDFDRRTDALAATFLQHAQVGDRVAHLMRNSPAYLETSVAAFKARMVHVNVNYRYTGEELFYILENSDAAVLVVDEDLAPLIQPLLPRLPLLTLVLQVGGEPFPGAMAFEAAAESGAVLAPQDHSPEDMMFLYTGGTTGLPKGVMWEQGALWALFGGGAPMMGLPPLETMDDLVAQIRANVGRNRSLVLPPLMHGTGFVIGVSTLLKGGTVITLPGHHFDPAAATSACAAHRADYAVIVGDAFARPLLKALDEGQGSIGTLNIMISSGTMWSPEVKAGLLRHHPGLMIIDSLGSSEGLGLGAAVQTSANAGEATRFIHDENTLVLGEDMQPVVPGSGVMGKIARGGHIPRGYWKDPVKSAATFVEVDGKRYSLPGDWATVDADGSIVLLGRGSQCINTAGEKVFPEEVEEALKTHPAVEDALVFGIPDEKWGQRVTAVVEATSNVTPDALIAHVHTQLAGYKAPKQLFVVPKVPRAPNGKADYATARAMAGA